MDGTIKVSYPRAVWMTLRDRFGYGAIPDRLANRIWSALVEDDADTVTLELTGLEDCAVRQAEGGDQHLGAGGFHCVRHGMLRGTRTWEAHERGVEVTDAVAVLRTSAAAIHEEEPCPASERLWHRIHEQTEGRGKDETVAVTLDELEAAMLDAGRESPRARKIIAGFDGVQRLVRKGLLEAGADHHDRRNVMAAEHNRRFAAAMAGVEPIDIGAMLEGAA